MLLRRMIQHVTDQNWFAVFIDFVIVVVGVFIGIQVSNWNDGQSRRHDYAMALQRYAAEIDANVTDLEELQEKSLQRLAIVRDGFDTLLTCKDSPTNRQIVEAGVRRMVGTYGIDVRNTSLRELTETPGLLAQQSATERTILNDTRVRVDFLLSEAVYFENLPLETRVEKNPMLAVGQREPWTFGQFSNEPSLTPSLHKLVLAVPLDVACKDDALLKAFYTWELWQSAIPDVARALKETLDESRKGLNL